MAANPFKSTIERYDKLIQLIIENLEKLFHNLLEDKRKHAKLRDTIVHRFYAQKKELVANKRAELERKAREGSYTISDTQLRQIDSLQAELDSLIEKEMDIERREAIAIKDDPARIDLEITAVQDLLKYIKDNAGRKDKRRTLDTEAMYNKIKDIYNSVLTRKEELDLTDKEFKPLQQQIEAKAKQIIDMLDELIKSISSSGRGPSGGPSGGPSAEVPKEVVEAVEHAQKVLFKEEGYFMTINKFAKELQAIVKSNMDTTTKIRQMRRIFKKLKRIEGREQFRGSVAKLRGRLVGILRLRSISIDPSVDSAIKEEIQKLIQQLKIFEGETLVETVEEAKKLKEGDTTGAEKAIGTIVQDSAAVVSIEERLKKILGGLKKAAEGIVRRIDKIPIGKGGAPIRISKEIERVKGIPGAMKRAIRRRPK